MVTLPNGGDVSVELVVDRGLEVRGFVRLDGQALPQASVAFSAFSDAAYSSAQADASGRYSIVGLTPGRYSVRVDAATMRGGYETSLLVKESRDFDLDIRSGRIEGRVVDVSSEAPIRDVDIHLQRLEPGAPFYTFQDVTTDARGRFALDLLSDGRYRIVTAARDFAPATFEFEVRDGSTPELVLRLQRGAKTRVRVSDARDGRTLSASVVIRDLSRRMLVGGNVTLDDDGYAPITLEPGDYLLSASAGAYASRTIPLRVPGGDVTIALSPGGTLVLTSARELYGEVRLVRPDGEEYVRCWCNGIAPFELRGTRTVIENVEAGSYALRLSDLEGKTLDAGNVTIGEGQVTTKVIE